MAIYLFEKSFNPKKKYWREKEEKMSYESIHILY